MYIGTFSLSPNSSLQAFKDEDGTITLVRVVYTDESKTMTLEEPYGFQAFRIPDEAFKSLVKELGIGQKQEA